MVNGIADGQGTLFGLGARLIVADALDSAGKPGQDWVVVKTDSSAPDVWIESPVNGAVLTAGIGTMVAGNSWDNDTWMPLPCSSLVWTTIPAEGTWQGCSPVIEVATPGQRTLVLTGTDADGLSDVDQVTINVDPGLATGPPQVTIQAPGYNQFIPRTSSVILIGKADDPDDKSPIQFEWVIHGPNIFGGSPAVIHTAGGNDDQPIYFLWTPANDVAITCGGVPLTLELRAVDADNEQGSTSIPIYIGDPPC